MPTNVLSVYDPIFYAQEALIQLEKALGLAGRVHRGHEKSPQQKGSIVSIRVPSTFSAQNAPSAAQDINADEVQIPLTNWKDVAFSLTDKELTYTGEVIINEHIRPAAYALADHIDQTLAGLYAYIPWQTPASSPAAVSDLTDARKILFNNETPMDDDLHLMVDGNIEAELLNLAAFSQHQGAGEIGVDTQMRGFLGKKFGLEVFANQNAAEHTAGAATIGTQLQLNAGVAAGATSCVFKDSGGSLTGTVKAGDTFVIAGSTQQYVITADATASSNLITVASFEPKAAITYSTSDNVTLTQTSGTQCMAFHKNAIALAMAPLSEVGAQLEGRVATVTDPITNLSLRSRIFYEGKEAAIYVVLDILYGYKVLKHNMAVRLTD